MGADQAAHRVEAFADRYAASGDLTHPAWRRAVLAAPRHLFAPPRAWCAPEDERDGFVIDRDERPDQWWDAAYDDAVIITQLDDGAGDFSTGEGRFTSSLSAPAVVFAFLDRLYVQDHHRLLEIGTGTGWTAALLSHRVGEQRVTTIEIDQQLADQAAANLTAARYKPQLVVGDGGDGWADGAPYDRIHVTCGVRDFPYVWIAQLRPGGVLVAPWMSTWAPGHKLRLVADGRGGAVGRFFGPCGFMMLRSQRIPPDLNVPEDVAGGDASTTLLDPRTVIWDSYGADLAIAGQLPTVRYRATSHDDGRFTLRVSELDASEVSWARVACQPDADQYLVYQGGPRRLWEEITDAYLRWLSWGRPDRDRFGITITPESRYLWIDEPTRPIPEGL